MAYINHNHENVLDELRDLHSDPRDLQTEFTTTHEIVVALPAAVRRAVEQPKD